MSPLRLVRRTASLALALAGMSLAACASPAPSSPGSAADRMAAASVGADQAADGTAVPADAGQPAAGTATAPGYRRIELPGGEGQPFPYTVEVPEDWKVHEVAKTASLWLGPASAEPGDPAMILVRISPASLADPAAVAANIKASDAADPKWSAPLVELREVHGVQGILVRMDSGEGDAARSTLVLKLPLPKTSVDFMASAPQAQFESLRPSYERILFSVEPRK